MNPNTGTLPMFRTRADADITLGIYGRHPVLIRDDDPDGNPWKLSFSQGLFNMASDSDLFQTNDGFADAKFNGWSYKRDGKEHVPLYEAKMLSRYFDHRFSTYRGATQAQLNVGSLPRLSEKEHDDPDLESLARYWVDRIEVTARLQDRSYRDWLLGWRDIARSSDSRTFMPSVLPTTAVGDKLGFPSNRGGFLLSCVRLDRSDLLVVVGREQLRRTVPSFDVVELLAPGDDDRAGLGPGAEVVPRAHLVFQSREERLRGGIIEHDPTLPIDCTTPSRSRHSVVKLVAV